MKKVLSNFLIIVLLIVLGFVMYSKLIKKEKMVKLFGYQFLIVLTGSMEPEIKSGSLIVIKETGEYQVRRCCNL